MKILILTFYYVPDLSAGSFRMKSFVDQLIPHLKDEDTLEIITTMPNRYHTHINNAQSTENLSHNITIKRITLPRHKSGMLDQAFTFFFIFWVLFNIPEAKSMIYYLRLHRDYSQVF